MTPLTVSEIERELAEMRQEIAQMRDEERAAWAVVLAYLETQQRSLMQERAGIDRAIESIKNRPE